MTILMRYFERLPLLEIGARLKPKESAVHMRIERAIGRLRTALAKRGVTSTVAALTAVMTGRAVGGSACLAGYSCQQQCIRICCGFWWIDLGIA